MVVSYDFDFINQIERGLDMNSNHSVNLLIQKVFEIDQSLYREILM